MNAIFIFSPHLPPYRCIASTMLLDYSLYFLHEYICGLPEKKVALFLFHGEFNEYACNIIENLHYSILTRIKRRTIKRKTE